MRCAFLTVLLDAWSRKVIGYAFGPILDARLPLAALEAALDSRRPPAGCIHHSIGARSTLRGAIGSASKREASAGPCREPAIRMTTGKLRAS
jgi:transposase InsO family protein